MWGCFKHVRSVDTSPARKRLGVKIILQETPRKGHRQDNYRLDQTRAGNKKKVGAFLGVSRGKSRHGRSKNLGLESWSPDRLCLRVVSIVLVSGTGMI